MNLKKFLYFLKIGSNYNYHFIITGLSEVLRGELTRPGEKYRHVQDKYITFSVPIKKKKLKKLVKKELLNIYIVKKVINVELKTNINNC